ncbi:MAG: DUF1292 domain-containing protein [Clostridiales bacterium]|nr:DUF1292 domain-containing protein [Clostridiales bacterium]MDO5139844.1 DUF1292 domain-containing protein [Eubacteriales bacterium]
MEDNSIVMILDDGSEIEFTILESTTFQGHNYILVTDAPDDEDGECRVFKEVSAPDDTEAVYEDIQDEEEENAVFDIFLKMLDGEIDIER